MQTNPLISIVIPARNAAATIGKCLDSIKRLEYPGEIEVIVVDGMSEDGTRRIVGANGVIVLDNRKKGTPHGRNLGFLFSHGDFIAFTDADCVVDPKWLISALNYFEDSSVAGVSGPIRTPGEQKAFAQAVGLVFYLSVLLGCSCHREEGVLCAVQDIPTCNAMYRREALRGTGSQRGPFDEQIKIASDAELNYRLRKLDYKFLFTPGMEVQHYRRESPLAFWKQMYGYGSGRLRIGRKWPSLLNAVHIGTGLSLPVAMVLLALFFFYPSAAIPFLGFGALFLGGAGSWAFFKTKSVRVALCFPLALTVLVSAWSAGFFGELVQGRKSKAGGSLN